MIYTYFYNVDHRLHTFISETAEYPELIPNVLPSLSTTWDTHEVSLFETFKQLMGKGAGAKALGAPAIGLTKTCYLKHW